MATVISSLATGNQHNIELLIAAGALPPLLDTLASSDPKMVDAGVRALRAIVQHPSACSSHVFQTSHINDLISLLGESPAPSSVSIHIAEVAASILARIAENDPQARDAIASTSATSFLVKWLHGRWSVYPKVQEAVLDALASLCKDNPRVAKSVAFSHLLDGQKVMAIFIDLVKDKRASTRLSAIACITHLSRTSSIPREHQQSIVLIVLPTLIRLFSDSSPINSSLGTNLSTISERAMALFATLVSESQELQSAAMEGSAITKLAEIASTILSADPGADSKAVKIDPEQSSSTSVASTGDKLRESCLLAISGCCSLKEECRKQVIDSKLLPYIIAALSNKTIGIRAAACRCTRSLSRSVKNLRTTLMDAGIANPLFDLLYDASIDVQTTASATICNIVLDFSPMKAVVLEKGVLNRLVELVNGQDRVLRLNAVWALKNMLFQADSPTKAAVMKALDWATLLR